MSNNNGRAVRRQLNEQSTSSQERYNEGRVAPTQSADRSQYAFSTALNKPVSRTSSIRSRLGAQYSSDIADERSFYDTPFEDTDFEDHVHEDTDFEDHVHEEPRQDAGGNNADTTLARQSTQENRLASVQTWRAQNDVQSPDGSGNHHDEERARMDALSRTYLANQRRRNEKRASDQTLTDYRSQLQNQDGTSDAGKRKNDGSNGQSDSEPRRPRAKSMDSFTYEKLTRGENNPYPIHRADHYNGFGGRDLERGGSRVHISNKNRRGILGQLKDTLYNLARDPEPGSVPNSRAISREPSQCISRRNSWSGSQGPRRAVRESLPDPYEGLNNFERSQAINAEYEETYLIDEDDHEGLRHRLQRHYAEHQMDKSLHGDERKAQAAQRKSYNDRRKREKHRIKYHIESTENYQKFIIIFAKALLTFGSPSHRIEAQLNSITKVFDIEAEFQHVPGSIQVSFGNPETKSSETCLIKSTGGVDLGRIHGVHNIYRAVLHDDMFASDGTYELRKLIHAPLLYGKPFRYVLSFITCFVICGIAFSGSLNDMWVSGLMGLLVRHMQNIALTSDLSASGSEVFTAALVSFIARGFASFYTQIWCFTAISSSGLISMLPGHLILAGSLDIAGRNQALGSPKIVSGIMTSLYLGFGLTLGSDVFLLFDKAARRAYYAAANAASANVMLQGYYQAYNGSDSTDSFSGYFTFISTAAANQPDTVGGCFRDTHWPWVLQPLPYWTLFFLVPIFAFCASMNNQQHWWNRQMFVMVTIACVSFWITRLCNTYFGLRNHPDYVSLIGSWIVGILGNGYSRRFGGTAFTAMLTGILLLVPDGLSAAGGLSQNYGGSSGQDEYTQSLTLARKVISVIIGILSGVYSSAAIIYLFGKKKNAALVTF